MRWFSWRPLSNPHTTEVELTHSKAVPEAACFFHQRRLWVAAAGADDTAVHWCELAATDFEHSTFTTIPLRLVIRHCVCMCESAHPGRDLIPHINVSDRCLSSQTIRPISEKRCSVSLFVCFLTSPVPEVISENLMVLLLKLNNEQVSLDYRVAWRMIIIYSKLDALFVVLKRNNNNVRSDEASGES